MDSRNVSSIQCRLLFLNSVIFISTAVQAQTVTPAAALPAAKLAAKTAASTAAPSSGPPVKPTAPAKSPSVGSAPQAQLLFRKFDEAQFQESQKAGRASLLVFAESGNATWLKQGPALQILLRDSERIDVDVFQIEAQDRSLTGRFQVTQPGTLIVIKNNLERLRSSGMIKDSALRSFLRLIPIL